MRYWVRVTLTDHPYSRPVLGDKVGPFAIHRSVGTGFEEMWAITHTRTGYSVGQRYKSKENATRALNRIRALGYNWDFDHPGEVHQCLTSRQKSDVRRIINEEEER